MSELLSNRTCAGLRRLSPDCITTPSSRRQLSAFADGGEARLPG